MHAEISTADWPLGGVGWTTNEGELQWGVTASDGIHAQLMTKIVHSASFPCIPLHQQ